MQTESLYAVFITLATVLGSAGAWKYYERKAQYKKDEDDFIKDDCAKRIDRLELLLHKSSEEKDDLRDKILELTKDLAELSIKVQYLEQENRRLLELNNQFLNSKNLDNR